MGVEASGWGMFLAQRVSRVQPGAERQRCPGGIGSKMSAA
jgi:hypothetical protein